MNAQNEAFVREILDIIRKRRSVRTFDSGTLSLTDMESILKCAENAENPYGQKIEWKLLDRKTDRLSSPVIVGTDIFIAGKMKRMPHAEEAFGYSFEKAVLYAASIGIGTTWIAGTMNRAAFEKAVDLADDEVLPCVSPLGRASDRMSVRETLMRSNIGADRRADFTELFYNGSFDRHMTPADAGSLFDVLEAVRLAPSAVNKQPWRIVVTGDRAHFYEKHSRGFAGADGWDIQKIDMGIALCHFDLAARACGFEPVFEIGTPSVAADEDTEYIASYILK